MTRLKPLLYFLAAAVAVTTLVRSRLGESQPVDAGGWKPVEPAR